MDQTENSLSRYLREANTTLSALAIRMGRSPSTLTRAIKGERDPSIGLARDVERWTDGKVPAAEFMAICLEASPPEAA